MAGITISAELVDEEMQQELRSLLARMDRLRPFYEAVGNRLVGSSSLNFRNQSGPDGTAWAPHAASTIRARMRKGQLPLTILKSNTRGTIGTTLAGSVRHQASEAELLVGSNKETAAIHQLGGVIQRPSRPAKIYRAVGVDGTVGRRFVRKDKADRITDVTIPAYQITIPARPFIGISKDDAAGIFEDAERWLKL